VDLTAGEGTEIKVEWMIRSKKDQPFIISLRKVKCVVDKLDIDIKEAKHEIWDKFVKTFFAARIKKSIAQNIVDSIVTNIEPFNDQLNEFFRSHPWERFAEIANEQLKEAYTRGQEVLREQVAPKIRETTEAAKQHVKEFVEAPEEKKEPKEGRERERKPLEIKEISKERVEPTTERPLEIKRIGKEEVKESPTHRVEPSERQTALEEHEKKKNLWDHEWTHEVRKGPKLDTIPLEEPIKFKTTETKEEGSVSEKEFPRLSRTAQKEFTAV